MIKVNGTVIKQNHFPDNTLFIKMEGKPLGPMHVEWFYKNDAELFTLICIRKYFGDKYPIILTMPYVPHARMDRVKNEEDVFTLKYFCEVINSLNFWRVQVLDVHSNVALALLDNIEQLQVAPYIRNASQFICDERGDYPTLYFPDEGAMKRYSEYAEGEPYAFGIKKRDWNTGFIEGIQVQNEEVIKGKDVFIVDDICSKGGTFYHSAKKLKELGAENIYLYITHCENTILEGDLLTSGLIEKVYTTNSIFTKEHEKIEVFEL